MEEEEKREGRKEKSCRLYAGERAGSHGCRAIVTVACCSFRGDQEGASEAVTNVLRRQAGSREGSCAAVNT